MKLRPFESEYGDDALPQVGGEAITNAKLNAAVAAMDPTARVEASQQTVVIDAVHSYYLAKRFWHLVESFDGYTNAVIPAALNAVGQNLMRLAVVAVATVNDSGKNSRTKSLPHTLDVLDDALAGKVGDVSAERAGLKSIKKSIGLDAATSLRYLNYIRNKWAGHASLDREFDRWADADTSISLPLVEDALVRLVNAHQALADLITGSPLLQALSAASSSDSKGDAAVIPFRVEWGAVTPWLCSRRNRRHARRMLSLTSCSPRPGTGPSRIPTGESGRSTSDAECWWTKLRRRPSIRTADLPRRRCLHDADPGAQPGRSGRVDSRTTKRRSTS